MSQPTSSVADPDATHPQEGDADSCQQQSSQQPANDEDEEFLLHLKFDHGSYPLRHNVNDIEFLGIVNGNLLVRIGDSYFMGEYDRRNNSSVLCSYDKQHQAVYETNKCHSKILMKRVLLKPKEKSVSISK